MLTPYESNFGALKERKSYAKSESDCFGVRLVRYASQTVAGTEDVSQTGGRM